MVISNPRELEKLKDRIPNLINIIRVAIVFPLMIMHILGLETGSRANLHASWTAWAFYVWLAIACWLIFFSIIHPHWQWQALRIPSFSAVADITMIGVLTYLFGGIDSGFGILILPFVVCSCPQLRALPPALCQLRRHPADIQRHCRRRYRQISAHIGCPNRLGNLHPRRRPLSFRHLHLTVGQIHRPCRQTCP